MSLPIGNTALGQARHNDAFTAGRSAATEARRQLLDSPGWALVFGGGRHDPVALLAGLREVVGDIPLVGGSAVGLITGKGATLTGFECGLLLFGATLAPQTIVTVAGLDRDECETGRRLGNILRASCQSNPTILLFYDSIHSASPPRLHVGSRLMEGLYEGLGELKPTLIGAGTLGDMAMGTSFIFDGREARKHAVVAVVMPEGLASYVQITHGCFPASDFMTITGLEGARVLALDGRPAFELAAERLGLPTQEFAEMSPVSLALTLGEKQGDPFAPFADENYNNRLVVAADAETGALILFEADFALGSRVQLMDIDPQRMIDSARDQTQRLLATLGDQAPLFALYIDCAGRSMAFSGLDEDESAPVRDLVGARCSLLGFFSGVELAPVRGRTRPLDWTGVLAVFTQARE